MAIFARYSTAVISGSCPIYQENCAIPATNTLLNKVIGHPSI